MHDRKLFIHDLLYLYHLMLSSHVLIISNVSKTVSFFLLNLSAELLLLNLLLQNQLSCAMETSHIAISLILDKV